jgi:hypothetical protein
MATRRNVARTQEQSDMATVRNTGLLPALREYRTSDLKPSTPPAYVRAMLAVARDLAEIEETQAPAGPALQ